MAVTKSQALAKEKQEEQPDGVASWTIGSTGIFLGWIVVFSIEYVFRTAYFIVRDRSRDGTIPLQAQCFSDQGCNYEDWMVRVVTAMIATWYLCALSEAPLPAQTYEGKAESLALDAAEACGRQDYGSSYKDEVDDEASTSHSGRMSNVEAALRSASSVKPEQIRDPKVHRTMFLTVVLSSFWGTYIPFVYFRIRNYYRGTPVGNARLEIQCMHEGCWYEDLMVMTAMSALVVGFIVVVRNEQFPAPTLAGGEERLESGGTSTMNV
ncbi:unnamed protein product [Zymoseptoria tritici ST99CH_1E4]|uniref:Uncharacterized protein n=1 Tax=Zymoseptoria tritici ST99CH_1E4 TaxID=1276532 RepID=A0A2H1GXC5_ZYMTR|nr:unnamed protein product [Zymoseptoria tritici ST99CH_1E4]